MTDSDSEKKLSELSAKVHWLILGYKIGSTLLLIFFSLFALGAALSIPHYFRIFADALGPDHPLPGLTLLIFAAQNFLPYLALLWPVLGILTIWISRKISIVVTVPILLMVITIFQFAVTWLALYLPMVSLVSGLSDTPTSP